MALDQYYEKVDGDESGQPLVGGSKEPRITRAPPAPQKRSFLTTVAILALVTTVFLAAVAAVSSAVIAYRLPAATEAALKAKIEAEGLAIPAPSASPAVNKDVSGALNSDGSAADTKPNPIYGHTYPYRTCGTNADEARAAGCVFDVMMMVWSPPECTDTPLAERFLAKGNWTWYANSDASKTYTNEEIRLGNHDVVYVAQSYHRQHCIFTWERLVRAMRTQSPIIEELISYDHVMHCRVHTLVWPEEGAEPVRGVVAPTGYTKCASYDVWIDGNLPYNKMSSSDKREMKPWDAEILGF